MEHVYNNYEEAQQKAKAMKQLLMEEFDVRRNVQKHEELYINLINSIPHEQQGGVAHSH